MGSSAEREYCDGSSGTLDCSYWRTLLVRSVLIMRGCHLNGTAGLDVVQRPLLSDLLGELHFKQHPIVIMELRPQDPLPEWITHVAVAEGQQLRLMERKDYSPHANHNDSKVSVHPIQVEPTANKQPLMDLKDVRIKYGRREVRAYESAQTAPLRIIPGTAQYYLVDFPW